MIGTSLLSLLVTDSLSMKQRAFIQHLMWNYDWLNSDLSEELHLCKRVFFFFNVHINQSLESIAGWLEQFSSLLTFLLPWF